MSVSLEQGALGPESKNDLPWHKDEWGSGSYLYQNVHGSVGYVDGPGSNPGLVCVIKVFGNDRAEIRDRIDAALSASAPASGAERMTAGEGSWTLDRTRSYLVAELERLKADLNTVGEDLTGEQGKAFSWLAVALGRVANVSSVLAALSAPAPATPPGVPDSVRALSEAVREVVRAARKLGDQSEDCGDGSQHVDADAWRYLAETIENLEALIPEDQYLATAEHAVTLLLKALATHPAGQSAGSGAVERSVEHAPQCGATTSARHNKPAPDSTRTGDEGTVGLAEQEAVTKAAERAVKQLENAASGGLFHCEADREEAVEIITEALWGSPLAARPAAPEAEGAWRDEIEALVAREWPEGHSAGAAARELARALGVSGIAPMLLRLLTELLSTINFASTDRSVILADFANAAPEAARTAKLDSFERWNPHVFDPAPPSSSGQGGR